MPQPRPFISIITPTFNAEKWIERCIDSVQAQSLQDFEHLIVDGHSTDRTLEFVQESMKKHPSIRIISEPDQGIFDAMNKGIKLARAEWLYFLGADDTLYDAEVLRAMTVQLTKSSGGIVYGNVYAEQLQRVYDQEFGLEKILKHNICHQAIFYHEKVFKDAGLYDLHYRTEADLSGLIGHAARRRSFKARFR